MEDTPQMAGHNPDYYSPFSHEPPPPHLLEVVRRRAGMGPTGPALFQALANQLAGQFAEIRGRSSIPDAFQGAGLLEWQVHPDDYNALFAHWRVTHRWGEPMAYLGLLLEKNHHLPRGTVRLSLHLSVQI